jgi:LAO/AO transport system kinase
MALSSLAQKILDGDRAALARSITLVESQNAEHTKEGQALLNELLPKRTPAIRVGISGSPGVGKSSLIETLGLELLENGLRLAVLAVDPSSPVSGGSILGDKTRMEDLARDERAFIRPSPSSGHLGGVARRTREALLLCEAAGFDVIVVETVGVGQSEIDVANMVDTFVLLLHPGAGDELQGVKRGVMEISDIVVVNKADGSFRDLAAKTQKAYEHGLSLLRPQSEQWPTPPVLLASALEKTGLKDLWEQILAHQDVLGAHGILAQKRSNQAEDWMWSILKNELHHRFQRHESVVPLLKSISDGVRNQTVSPTHGALSLLNRFFGDAK